MSFEDLVKGKMSIAELVNLLGFGGSLIFLVIIFPNQQNIAMAMGIIIGFVQGVCAIELSKKKR